MTAYSLSATTSQTMQRFMWTTYRYNTTYHNEHLLEVPKDSLEDGDTFTVSIVSKAPRVLRTSKPYVYKENNGN